MANLVEDLDMLVTRVVTCLTRLLYHLCQRLEENSHRAVTRRTLVRWLAAFMPRPQDPRLQLQSTLSAGCPVLGRWSSCGSLVSSASINQFVEEEDLGNNIVRFRLGGHVADDGDVTEDTSFFPSMKLADIQTLTSTPKMSTCSMASSDHMARDKLTEMEEELAVLRKQIAMLVMAQESSSFVRSLTDTDPVPINASRVAGVPLPLSPAVSSLDDSGCESEVVQGRLSVPASREERKCAPVPPHPPPPPVASRHPRSSCTQEGSRLISSSNLLFHERSNTSREDMPDMTAVLKDLASVKLRAVQRSPGGTPMRQQPEREPTDPAAIIAQALKKKFSNHWLTLSPESDKENESSSFVSDQSTPQTRKRSARKVDLLNESVDNWTSVSSPVQA